MAKPDKRKEALALLARNVSQSRVAEIVGVDRRTIVRWLKQPEFKSELLSIRRDHLEDVLDQTLQSSNITATNQLNEIGKRDNSTSQIDTLIGKAVAALDVIVSNPESRNSDRLRASELILKLLASDYLAQTLSNSKSSPNSIGTLPDRERESQIDAMLRRRELLLERKRELEAQTTGRKG